MSRDVSRDTQQADRARAVTELRDFAEGLKKILDKDDGDVSGADAITDLETLVALVLRALPKRGK